MKKVIVFIIITLIVALMSLTGLAHSGGTDSNGGHYDRSTGDYHYHHGHPAHDHTIEKDGTTKCPYEKKGGIGMLILSIVFAFVTLFLGLFGFSNIIGCLKYRVSHGWITILLWLLILGGVGTGLCFIVSEYWYIVLVGYLISFFLSLGVKLD